MAATTEESVAHTPGGIVVGDFRVSASHHHHFALRRQGGMEEVGNSAEIQTFWRSVTLGRSRSPGFRNLRIGIQNPRTEEFAGLQAR